MTMFRVLFTRFNEELTGPDFSAFLQTLPAQLQTEILRYVRWQDRQAHLFGKLLLIEGLKRFEFSAPNLDNIQYSSFKKPFLQDCPFFNLSHSGWFVACALSDHGEVGLDIEEVRPINMSHFKRFFSEEQWSYLRDRDYSLKAFYELWVRLESTVKWLGKGIYTDLKRITLNRDTAFVDGQTCYHKAINLDPNYPCYVASDTTLPDIQPEFISLGDQKNA